MLRPTDAVEVSADGAETVASAYRTIVEILNLLQHRIGPAVGEDIAGDQQNRQTVDVRERRRRDHVRRARPDRGCDRHRFAALHRLRIGDCRVSHGLFVLAAPGGKPRTDPMQRLADPGHIAMAKNGPDTFDEAIALGRHLRREPSHHRLGGRQSDCFHESASSRAFVRSRAVSQTTQRR
jgi:hypothetical protein